MDEKKKVGVGLVGFGIFFSFMGVILFFDRGLLALGNIFFLLGVALLLGWLSTLQLFKRNYKGSISFFFGLSLIFVGWPVLGIVIELYGSFVLFSGFWPSLQAFLYHIPFVGWLLQYPFMFFDWIGRIFG